MFSLVLAVQGHAQNLMVRPAQGQSQEQQQGDEFECYNWSKQQKVLIPWPRHRRRCLPRNSRAGKPARWVARRAGRLRAAWWVAYATANRDSKISRLVFDGLTAYDTQQIKLMYNEADGEEAIMGTLKLYLGFPNMFIFLTHILGATRK